ncbi:hypothetical protein SLEP1_g31334 [Rubroshorea leprosula]|uniref:Uncharacterized protein n=1 Tax=Rubroshorea leprosula TaxID=152421 RepID=A0AAV5KAD2_9ROSI|nr:hypothetical protein SLEP1_g31334 [Rubroshorea leprosula]
MSSKETLSVEGSEEVTVLEYGNEGIENGSSRLRELRVRRYNVKADIVFEVKGYETELGTRDGLVYLVETYDLPPQVLISPAREKEKACSAPRDHWMPMSDAIEATKLYGPSLLSEDVFAFYFGKRWKEREQISSSSAQPPINEPRLELKHKGSEDLEPTQRKKKRVEEIEVRGDEVVEFVPRPPPIELDPELKEIGVVTHGKGKALVPPLTLQNNIFDTKSSMEAKNFLNAYLLEMDRRQAREEVLSNGGSSVVKHALEQKRKIHEDKIEAQEKERKKMKESQAKLKKNVKLLVHIAMEEHIVEFLNSSTFDNIVNLYHLPIAILAFTDCRKKVKAQYPKVDVMRITFGEQKEGVEENGKSMSTDFQPQIKLRWDRTIFPSNFDFKFIVVEEGNAEVEGAEVEESQAPHPVEIHLVPSEEDQPAPPVEDQPPLPAE